MNSYERFMDQLHVGTLLKALSISREIKDVTIGPSCKDVHYDEKNEESKEQSESSQSESPSTTHLNDILASHTISDIIHNFNQERLNKVERNMEKRLNTFQQFNNLLQTNYSKNKEILQEDINSKILWEENQIFQKMKEHEQKLEQERILQEQQMAKRLKKRKQLIEEETLREQKEAKQKLIIEEELKKKNEIRTKLFTQLFSIHQQFIKNYTEILEMIKKHKNNLQYNEFLKNSKHLSKLKQLKDQMDLLIKQCKDGDVNNSDVKTASAILDQLNSSSTELTKDLDKIKENKSENIIKTSIDNQVPKNHNKIFDLSRVQQKNKETIIAEKYQVDEKLLIAKFNKFNNYLKDFTNVYNSLLTDSNLKKFRNLCQNAIIVPVNAISAESSNHMRDKYIRLKRLISGGNIIINRNSFSVNSHPQGVLYCKFLLSQKLVSQGEIVVSSNSKAAHPIASIAVALWADFPDFGHLLLAHFYNRCPYLIPVVLPRSEKQTNLEYYKMLGYLVENGSIEPQEKYIRRMSGLMRLYSAIIIAHPKSWHPFGIKNALDWLYGWINQDPILDITATLLFDLLEITGYFLYNQYREIFWNLLIQIKNVYLPLIYERTDKTMMGPVVRLDEFITNVIKSKRLTPPEGYLRPNYW